MLTAKPIFLGTGIPMRLYYMRTIHDLTESAKSKMAATKMEVTTCQLVYVLL